MFILIRDTHHRHAISLRPGVVVYVRVVVVCEGYPYSDQHPARRRLSLLLSRSRQQELGQVPILSNLFQNLQARSACENFEEICSRT